MDINEFRRNHYNDDILCKMSEMIPITFDRLRELRDDEKTKVVYAEKQFLDMINH